MISSRNRFHGLNSFKTVYKFGQTVRSQQINIKYNLNNKRASYRCAVVVAKKVEKSAVRRNRIRRRVFEAFRQLASGINKPYDIVISVYSPTLTDMPAKELQQQLAHMLTEANILDGKS